jgi:hypothetical protein
VHVRVQGINTINVTFLLRQTISQLLIIGNPALAGEIREERVMGFEPTNGSLGSYCLTTWQHPQDLLVFILPYVRGLNPSNLGVIISESTRFQVFLVNSHLCPTLTN